ncbi:MAG: HAMP domain-containing histidine kinase [Ectothiorhodospiraceae bacterium]|nr:HAMP domain-containing histidine kinase [Chromatiales bacterium]MCP5155444.1 HAMP domain-containing histidine kinase [Ectothiorhodospiraceae bacterium]
MTGSPLLRTLYAKLSLVLVGLLLSVGAIYTVVVLSTTRHQLETLHQRVNRDLARNLVADRNLVAEGRLEQSALKALFAEYMTINPSIEIYLLDLGGEILSFSADPGKVKRRRVSLAPIHAFLAGDTFPLLGDDPRSPDRRKIFSATPVPSSQAPEGYLYVVLRGEEYQNVAQILEQSVLLRLSGWAVVASLGFGLVAGLALFHLLTRRLQRLAADMEQFRASGFTAARPESSRASLGGDEVDRLALTFDAMAGRISEQLDALREQDRLRRDLVARVSHDLRTPLASLHGYLETLQLKAADLDAAAREEHLAVALRQSERLRRLIGELFELAKLEAREARPRAEPFAVPDLVQDVCQKLRIHATDRGCTLEAAVDGEVPLAIGDVSLVERVLENLIDNALDHTPAGGRVRIPVDTDGTRIRVSVADDGAGIPEDELGRIFEPFHRAPGRAGAERLHAGLGLPIARRIVELHGGTLTVSSRPGAGATFTFDLPAWTGREG